MIKLFLKSNHKAFSYIELLVVLAILVILALVSAAIFQKVELGSGRSISWTSLDQAVTAAQTQLLPNGGGYPNNLVSLLHSNGLTFTSGFSMNENTVSTDVVSSLNGGGYENVVFAVLDQKTGYCYIGVDSLGGSPTWGVSSTTASNSCSAGNAAGSINSILSISQTVPSTITM